MSESDFIYGVSGFRAKVGQSFEPQTIARFGQAFAALVRENGGERVVVGRDSRTSGEMAFHAVAAGLLASGLDVIDAGIHPTPTILHATAAYDADGSVTLTASHNPIEWNGMEFSVRRGRLLNADERTRLRTRYEENVSPLAEWDSQGVLETRADAMELHLSKILSLPEVHADLIGRRKLRVVIDACNGAGSLISPELIRRLGAEAIPVHCEPNGRFPRAPEPSPESLEVLMETVVRENADVGFAHDADADRLVIVDERGRFVPEEYTFALVADVILRHVNKSVVTTVVTGGLLDEVARRHGVPIHRTPVGVGHVVEKMTEIGAAVGGESTGGVVIPGTHLTTDGIAAIAVLLTGLAGAESLSEWVSRWKTYHLVKAKIPLTRDLGLDAVYDAVVGMYSEAQVERIDGVRLLWGDAWVSVRPSGTEPALRVFAESSDERQASELLTRTVARVKALL